MAAKKIKLTNTLRQALNITLKDGRGVGRNWTLPAKGSKIIFPIEMSQDVVDKEDRGYLKVTEIEG